MYFQVTTYVDCFFSDFVYAHDWCDDTLGHTCIICNIRFLYNDYFLFVHRL